MQIERALPEDATAISGLVMSVAHHFLLDPQWRGAEGFLQSVTPAAIERYIASPEFAYFKAVVQGHIAGVVAVRGHTHLYHLFVRPGQQGKGLARQLWHHAQSEATNPAGVFTVNSTPHAKPVYEKFGFRAIGERVETMGIAYIPMRLDPDENS